MAALKKVQCRSCKTVEPVVELLWDELHIHKMNGGEIEYEVGEDTLGDVRVNLNWEPDPDTDSGDEIDTDFVEVVEYSARYRCSECGYESPKLLGKDVGVLVITDDVEQLLAVLGSALRSR